MKKKKNGIPAGPKPYVAGAFFCEKVLIEKDEVVTAVRMVDRVTLATPPAEYQAAPGQAPIPAVAGVMFLLSLRSLEIKGEHEIAVDVVTPSGKRLKGREVRVTFLPGRSGINTWGQLPIIPAEKGHHWYVVKFDGRELTRVPLEVVHKSPPQESESASTEPREGKK